MTAALALLPLAPDAIHEGRRFLGPPASSRHMQAGGMPPVPGDTSRSYLRELATLARDVAGLTNRVDAYLRKMGVAWS